MSVIQLQALANILSLALLFVVWVYGVKPAILDTFRQHMFRLRDEMFDFMAEGNISPESEAYQMVRHRMNTAIRYAERLDLLTFVGLYGMVQSDPIHKLYNDRLRDSLRSLDATSAMELQHYISRTNDYLLAYVFARSFFLSLAWGVIYLGSSAFIKTRRKLSLSDQTARAIDMEAALC